MVALAAVAAPNGAPVQDRTPVPTRGRARDAPLVVHPASRIRLLWVWSVTRGAGPGWGGCNDAPGARVERGGGAQAGADDALTEAGRGTGSPGADHPACG